MEKIRSGSEDVEAVVGDNYNKGDLLDNLKEQIGIKN